MPDDPTDMLEFDAIAAEFARRLRAGERPAPSDYVARYPQFADDIRDLFPTIARVEEPNRGRRAEAVPASIGEYRVVGLLGRGGMGVVYEAEQPSLDRLVALKVLAPEWAADPTARVRFLREARAAAAVGHPNVVATFAVGEHDGRPYLTQELVRGESLAQRVARAGPLPLDEALSVAGQVARGLAAAHAQGLVHRDVKPANVLLEAGSGRALLTDFGLARVLDQPGLTRSGDVAGTPQYMSPEQAQGLPADARTDLFSLGGLITTLLTGRPPFRGESSVAVLRSVCDDAPLTLGPSAPPWLAATIARLLAKDPTNRFATSAEVATLLERGLEHFRHPESVPSPTVPGVPRNATRHWPIVVAAALLPVIGLTVWLGREPPAPPKPPPDATEILTSSEWEWTPPENLGPVVNSPVEEMNPYVTADERILVFASKRAGGVGDMDLWESRRPSPQDAWGEPVNLGPVVNSRGCEDGPCLSGDGLTLVFISSRRLRANTDVVMCRRPSLDQPWGEPVNLGPEVNSPQFEFRPWLSADGLTLTFSSMRSPANGVWVCRRRTQEEPFGPAVPFGRDSHKRAVGGLSFTADGRVLLCNRLNAILPGDLLWLARIDAPDDPFRNLQSFGPAVNTDAIDTAPMTPADGRTVYFQSDRPGGVGQSDLWLTRRVRKGG